VDSASEDRPIAPDTDESIATISGPRTCREFLAAEPRARGGGATHRGAQATSSRAYERASWLRRNCLLLSHGCPEAGKVSLCASLSATAGRMFPACPKPAANLVAPIRGSPYR